MKSRGICVQSLTSALGFSAPQAIYKWLRGEGLPSVDNLFALSKLMDVPIDDILIQEGLNDSAYCLAPFNNQPNKQAVNYYYLHIQAA